MDKELNKELEEELKNIDEDKLKKKLDELKSKLDSLKKKILTKFKKHIVGISLLPPEKKESKNIDVLIVVDDGDIEDAKKFEMREKLAKVFEKMGGEVDKNIKAQTMLVSEISEACFDAKYDVLRLIAYGAVVYDPKDFLGALKACEIHKSMVLKKFEKYVVSYVAVGSLFRGDARSHDIDVAIVIDDTDVKRMNRLELRDKLGAIIRSMGYEASGLAGVKKVFHVQVYILTDFWDWLKEASPTIFTMLRDGVPIYDRGIFMSWKLLLKMGRIKPSPEAIDMHMDVGERLLERARGRLLSIFGEDMFFAALNPSQAALMMYGVSPPTPKETVKLLDEIFVKKEKLLESKYVKTLDKAIKYFKGIEHGKIKNVTGKEIDVMMKEVEEYLKRINRLFSQIEKKAEKERVNDLYNGCVNAIKDMLKLDGLEKVGVDKGFKKLVKEGKFPKNFVDVFNKIMKIKENYRKLNKHEIEKLRRESAVFMRAIVEYVQRKRGLELERAKIRVKYGDKYGEVFLLDNQAYIINDIDAEKRKIMKAKILPNGGIGKINDSNLQELESAVTRAKIPKKVFIKEKIFEDLRKLYGKDVEVLVNY